MSHVWPTDIDPRDQANTACRAIGEVREEGLKVGEDDFGHLERLVPELDARGLHARVVRTPSGRAFVRVINPNATSLAENVTCRAQATPSRHDWYYWWSWGELMHTVQDPAGAATKVARVLAAVGE